MKKLASAYVFSYAILHALPPFFGAYMKELGYLPTSICMISTFIATLSAVFINSKPLRIVLSIFYCLAWAGEWLQLVTWVPPWSHLQYVVVASMNFTCSVVLFMLSGVAEHG